MATALDLQEQEQLDDLKAFWQRWGNLISILITVVLLGFAGWNGWNWYQRDQGAKASAMYDSLSAAAATGDAERTARVFADMKDRYPRTVATAQGALVAARVQADKGQAEQARATLAWLADNAGDDDYRAVANLALAGLLLDAKQPDAALKALDAAKAPSFAALVADRRGDALMSQGKKDEARTAYQAAWKGLDAKVDYRQLVEAKLVALAAPPAAASAPTSAEATQ